MALPLAIPIIMAATSAIGAIGKGISAGNKRRKMDAYLNRQDAENEAWYKANALSDYTQRADTQNLMKQLRDTLGRQNKKATGSAVVTGATVEQQAAQKELSNKVISDTFSNIGAIGQRWKDNITNKYLDRKNSLAGQRMGMWGQKAAADEALALNAMQSAINIGATAAMGGFGSTGAATSAGSTVAANPTPVLQNLPKLPPLPMTL